MVRLLIAFFGWFSILGLPCLAQVDLYNLENYANQSIPSYITKDNTPVDNPITDAGATLGRVLFYDKALSTNHGVACSNCHQQEHAFSDLAAQSEGIDGALTDRHSMRLVNARFGAETKFRWDESASSLEEQMTLPIKKEAEMGYSGANGNPDFNDLIDKLGATSYYPQLFAQAFGDSTITEDRMQRAMAQFVRSIQSFDTKYDIGRAQVSNDADDFPNFTAEENAGKRLFMDDFEWVEDEITVDGVPGTPGGTFPAARRVSGGLNCATCHGGPEFDIDPDSLNNGFVRASPPGPNAPLDLEVFRSPTLRDMIKADGETLNGGMFHSGLATDLNLIFAHYDFRQLEPDNPFLDPRMTKDGLPQWLDITVQERQQMNAFLRTLTGTDVYTNEKWDDPFDEFGNLELIAIPGDFDLNGIVDGEDLLFWQRNPDIGDILDWQNNYGMSVLAALSLGDFDLNGVVDGDDFLLWQRNPDVGNLADWIAAYNPSGSSSSGNGTATISVAVPEPSSLLLVMTLLSGVLPSRTFQRRMG